MITWRWTVLSDGWTQAREAILIQGGSWRKMIRCVVSAVLLENRQHGAVLFDCGYSGRFFSETEGWPNLLYRKLTPATLSEPEGLAGVLRRMGRPAEQVRNVVISHWHADHVGGLKDFPDANVYANQRGWEWARDLRGLAALRQGVLPGLIPEDVHERLRNVDEGTDLFGDGSLIGLELPGHAVGQIGLRFVDDSGQRVLLASDACWLSRSFRENRMPHPITGILHDSAAYRCTLARLHELHLHDPGLVIVPSHCLETAARIEEIEP